MPALPPRRLLPVLLLLVAVLVTLAACLRPSGGEAAVETQTVQSPEEGGAVSRDPMPEEAAAPVPPPAPRNAISRSRPISRISAGHSDAGKI